MQDAARDFLRHIFEELNVSIEFDREEVLPLAKAARQLPAVRGSKPPNPSTIYRWLTAGVKSVRGETVKLETCFVGKTRCTSLAALKRFFDRINDSEVRPLPESADREKEALEMQALEAMQRMRAAGIISSTPP